MTVSRARLAVLLLAVAMALPLAGPAGAAPGDLDRVLVRFSPELTTARAPVDLPAVAAMRTGPHTGITIAEVARGSDPAQVAARLSARPDVVWAEADAEWHASSLSGLLDDPFADDLWGLDNPLLDVDVDAPAAWDITRGDTSVVVAVIDTGVQIGHPDLAANIWTNPGEVAGNGLDDDSNGLVDDVHGWDFHHDDASVYDASAEDRHGTHVAGTIAALADNGVGIAGVAPDVTIMPVKFLGPEGRGLTSDAVDAIEYAAAMGADVVNASWSGSDASRAMSDAIGGLDALFVAAAGNDSLDMDESPRYPAAYPHDNIVSVAAVDGAGRIPSWSNRGRSTVDFGAPGVGIHSTVPGGYAPLNGTSMAAPHVAGTAALVHAVRPGISPPGLARVLRDTTTPLASLDGVTVTGGIVRAGAALHLAAGITTPGAVRELDAHPGDRQAPIDWSAPADDGGLPVIDYVVTASPGTHRTATASTSTVLTGLSNGTRYTVTVAARTSAGTGTTSSTVVTPTAPAAADDETDDTPTRAPDGSGDTGETGALEPIRLAGGDRYATAAAIARHAFTTSVNDVYVATGAGFPDALAGTAAAAARTSPVLLVGTDHVPDVVQAELERLAPARIWVLGGPAAISDRVVGDLAASGADVRRLAGPDRFSTSAVVSAHAFTAGVDVAYVGTGAGFPDALGAGAAAGTQGGPVLLTAHDALPSSVAAELARLQPRRVVVLGGQAIVADDVARRSAGRPEPT